MSDKGWVKIHRKMLDNPVVMKDPDHLAVWMYLLLEAAHENHPTIFGGKKLVLKPGQLITGRKKIAKKMGIEEHKVDRIIKLLKNEQQIERRATPYGSVITIVEWDKYQNREQQNAQRVSNQRATSEQPVSTIQEWEELKEVEEGEEGGPAKTPPSLLEIKSYWEEHDFVSDPTAFYEHYADCGWKKKNGDPVTSWRRSAKAWEKREKRYMAERGQDPEIVRRTNIELKARREYKAPEPVPVEKAPMPKELRDKIERLGKKLTLEG